MYSYTVSIISILCLQEQTNKILKEKLLSLAKILKKKVAILLLVLF